MLTLKKKNIRKMTIKHADIKTTLEQFAIKNADITKTLEQ